MVQGSGSNQDGQVRNEVTLLAEGCLDLGKDGHNVLGQPKDGKPGEKTAECLEVGCRDLTLPVIKILICALCTKASCESLGDSALVGTATPQYIHYVMLWDPGAGLGK